MTFLPIGDDGQPIDKSLRVIPVKPPFEGALEAGLKHGGSPATAKMLRGVYAAIVENAPPVEGIKYP